MANFEKALQLTLEKEGFISNDSSDAGGFTAWGIAQKINPHWSGWAIITQNKNRQDFPECLKTNSMLIGMRNEFYRQEYWNKIKGDNIINQEVAEDTFDKSVNMGVKQAVILCQRTLGQEETGVMDTRTLNLLNEMNNYA